MADKENYRVAIDILCCHLGLSFDEACMELGLVEEDGKVCSDFQSTPHEAL
ncbi:MAG: hypothetical protein ACRCWB_10330 [Enterovibrio sp.]